MAEIEYTAEPIDQQPKKGNLKYLQFENAIDHFDEPEEAPKQAQAPQSNSKVQQPQI